MPGGEIGVKKSSPERVQPQSFQKHRRAGASPQEAEKKEEFLRMETSIDCAILQLCSCAPVRVACDNPPPIHQKLLSSIWPFHYICVFLIQTYPTSEQNVSHGRTI